MDLISISPQTAGGTRISIRNHSLLCGHGPADGGQDPGPSPAELLVAALGSCMALMIGHYCREHGYRDGSVEVHLTYEMAREPNRISAIAADLQVPRDVPADRFPVLRRIAEKCPVHATLARPPQIDLEIIQ